MMKIKQKFILTTLIIILIFGFGINSDGIGINNLVANTTGVRLQESVDGLLYYKIHNLHPTGVAGIWLIQNTTNTARITIDVNGNLVLNPDGEVDITGNVDASGTVDANGATLTGGTNTFNITNGTASIDVAADAAVNIDKGLTVDGQAVTVTGVTQANTLTFYESFILGDGNTGTLTYSVADKTLTVEDNATVGLDINALEGLSGTGLVSRTAANTYAERTLQGDANEITVTNGDGVSGNPSLSIDLNKDIVTTAPITGGTDNILVGADGDVTIAITVEKDLVTTSPLAGGTDDILTGADGDITISIADALADGSTKGAASFVANDFDATSGNVGIDYTNGQASATGVKGFLSGTDWDTFNNKVDNVPTELSIGTTTANTVAITSDGGTDDVTIPAAINGTAGLLTDAKWDEIVVNNGKITESTTVTSPLSKTTYDISITADGITDTQLEYNTGQHLTTTSDVEFNSVKVDGMSLALCQGVSWDQSADTYERLGSLVGIATSQSAGNANLPIQSDMKRCLLNDDGTVNYYLDTDNSYMKQYTTIPYSDSINYVNGDTIIVTGATFTTSADTGMWVHNVDSTYYAQILSIVNDDTLILSNSIFVVGDSLNQYNAILNGDDGQVMVQIPKFYEYYNRTGDVLDYYVSIYHLPGFVIHPAFLKDGVEVDYRYIAAYEAVPYDDGASAYNNGTGANATNFNGGAVDLGADKIGSVAGYKALSDETIVEFRTLARNRGSGWEQQDVFLIGAIQLLYLIEYADFNSQVEIGTGNTSYDGWDFDNNVGYGGYSNPDGNSTNASNTAAGGLTTTDVNDGITNREYMSYRGIENFYGSLWNFYDGLNVFDNKAYVCYKSSNYESYANAGAESLVKNHELIGTLANAQGYVQDIINYSFGFFANDVTGALSSTYLTDYYYQSTGWRVAELGGYANSGVKAGVFALDVYYDLTADDSYLSGRLSY